MACPTRDVLALWTMTRNTAMREVTALPEALNGRSIVLVGLMGAGKTSIGRRLAARLGLPFRDADDEIERAAGCTIPEIFSRFGEPYFRDGERRVIRRLLSEGPKVIAYGGGAFMDPDTRALTRQAAVSIWLRCSLATLVRRVASRDNRPLLANGDHEATLSRLMGVRYPIYAEADVIVDCGDESPETTTSDVVTALAAWAPPRRLTVSLSTTEYDVVIGEGLLQRAGAMLAPVLPQKRAVVVTDKAVAALHLDRLMAGLAETGFATSQIVVEGGEATKSVETWSNVVDQLLEQRVERRTAILALGGGVVGDLAGFAAAATLRGLPFVQIPTTLLAQVDSSVGGKTAVNTRWGKNLVGAFYQPRMVLADIGVLDTLPRRELLAGYAEVVKYGIIRDAGFFAWLERHGPALIGGDHAARAEAVAVSCKAKADIVSADEREQGERALLNLGHTFGHAMEAETGFSDKLLHGESVALGMVLALQLSERLGLCPKGRAERLIHHLEAVGLPASPAPYGFDADRLIAHMQHDKKVHAGKLTFILAADIGKGVISRDVPTAEVRALLAERLA